MAEIKSSYEIAMERFQHVEPDMLSLKKKQAKEKGRALCAQCLTGESKNLKKELSAAKKDEQQWLRDGMGEALLNQITLPTNELAISAIDNISTIAQELSSDATATAKLIEQYKQFSQQYWEAKIELSEQIKAQYMQMMQQQGQRGNTMDPQFLKVIQNQLKELDNQYKPSIQQVKMHIRNLCKISTSEEIDEEE